MTYVTKPDGEKRDTYTYDEFGKPRTGKLSPDGDKVLHTSFGYNGEQWDEESNLQYLRARYYEPETGRFLSRDSYEGELENPLSKHLYAYVQNNPVKYDDPSGHKIDVEQNVHYIQSTGHIVNKGKTQTVAQYQNQERQRVKNIQSMLNRKGFRDNKGKKLVVDGIWGPKTQQAYTKYQNSLKPKKAKPPAKPPVKKPTTNKTPKPAEKTKVVKENPKDDKLIGIVGSVTGAISAVLEIMMGIEMITATFGLATAAGMAIISHGFLNLILNITDIISWTTQNKEITEKVTGPTFKKYNEYINVVISIKGIITNMRSFLNAEADFRKLYELATDLIGEIKVASELYNEYSELYSKNY